MKKWNLYGWIAAVALSGALFLTGLPGEAKAQEVCETELEHEIQEQTQLEEQTEAETPEQTQSEEQTEAETQEQIQSEMQTETEAQEYMQYETETGLELLASQETTEAVPDNYFEDFTSATAYLREQMAPILFPADYLSCMLLYNQRNSQNTLHLLLHLHCILHLKSRWK